MPLKQLMVIKSEFDGDFIVSKEGAKIRFEQESNNDPMGSYGLFELTIDEWVQLRNFVDDTLYKMPIVDTLKYISESSDTNTTK